VTDPRLLDYPDHIVEAAAKIERYLVGLDAADFKSNGLVQDAVVRNVQIAGEASASIVSRFPDFVDVHPELELRRARAMRHVLVHDYSRVDIDVVWDTATVALPRLAAAVRKVLGDIAEDEP
jgi:uncharacterized protein with HEPN domain